MSNKRPEIMAEAMLEDSYRSSHSDLKEYGEQKSSSHPGGGVPNNDEDENPSGKDGKDRGAETNEQMENKAYGSRRVAIQLPPKPKRQKITPTYAIGDIIQGKLKVRTRTS
jgi:hypothetical protein